MLFALYDSHYEPFQLPSNYEVYKKPNYCR